MKKLIYSTIMFLSCNVVYAGLITRTYTYTDGNTISANENNTNENTIYTEFNGNIEAANIKDGTITNADIADTQIEKAKLSTVVQATLTYVNVLGNYRRPVLQFISSTAVDIENNTGTSNQTCVHFPDERRCVTEDTSSTDKYRRLVTSAQSSFTSGTEDSGMSPGETVANNTWYAVYAVKSQINTANFVLAISTNTPTQSNFSRLNTLFAVNGWVYLGMVRVGDNSGSTNTLLSFIQIGNWTRWAQATAGTVDPGNGIRMATTAGATSLSFTASAGTGATNIPSHLPVGIYETLTSGATSGTQRVTNAAASVTYAIANTNLFSTIVLTNNAQGIKITPADSAACDIFLVGWIDPVLGIGYNPQL